MSRFAARFFAALLCIGASAGASASTFTAGTGAGLPGSVVNIQLSISGDGLTHAAEMVLYIDGARLGFTSPPGPIPGAGQAGQCGWNGGNRVGALVFSPMAPLPSGNSIICTLPILIHENASPGRVALRIGSQRCVDGTQNPTACNTNDGWIDILGSADLATPLQDDETTSLAFLLSADAHASMGAALQQIDYGSQAGQAPLESFRQIPPRFVRALHQPPRGDHAARLARERESPEARLCTAS